MKILFLANHLNAGGISTYLLTLAQGLLKKGHSVIIASAPGDRVADFLAMGGQHVLVNAKIKCDIHPAVFFTAASLASFVKRQNVDIVHANTRSTQVCALIISILTGVPYVTTCHGFFNPHLGRRMFPLWGRKAIAISSQVKQHMIKDLLAQPNSVYTVPNGVDALVFIPVDEARKNDLRRAWNIGVGPLIGMIARLSDVKGQQCLIEAMPKIALKVPDIKCLLIGVGPQEASLKALARKLNVPVIFSPVVNKTPEVLPMFDVIIIPSLQEGIGLSAMEAGACGLPVVASRVGGLPEVISDGKSGVLVPPNDASALAEAIVRLLTDRSQARKMGDAARDIIKTRFSAAEMLEKTLQVYQVVKGDA